VLLVWRGGVVGGGCQDAGVAGAKVLRRIADPVVAGPAAGVRIRTRIRVSGAEATALTAIGTYLGSVYRGELAGRIRCRALDRDGRVAWRAERKHAVTAVSSSRWAGAITRAVDDQFQLGMRALAAQVTDLRAAVQVWRLGVHCGPANWRPLTATMGAAGVDRGVAAIAAWLSGSPRPGG
jgi:hypothetical protein